MLHPRYFLLQIQTKINQFQTIFTRQFEPFALVFGIQFLLWLFNHWRATIAPFSLNFLLKTLHLFKFHENKFQNEKKNKSKYLFLHLVICILNFCYLIPKSSWYQTNWHCTTNCSTLRSFFLACLTIVQNTLIKKPGHRL